MSKTQKIEKTRKKLLIYLLNSFVFIVASIGIWIVLKNYLHINDDTYVNNAQVKTYINPINSRVPGYIKDIHFQENQKVHQGDTLILLDTTDFYNAVAQAEAGLSQAIAAKASTLSSVKRVETSANTIDANMAGAKAQLENAKADLKRYENLLKNEAVTLQQYQQIETKVKTLEAQYHSLEEQKNTAHLSTAETQTQVAVSDAQIEAARVALERAKLNLKYTAITAPEDGIMGRRTITTGQFIQPGQQIATLVQNKSKWVQANILESQVRLVQVGDILRFTIDAMGDVEFEGKVTSIAAATGSEFSSIPTDNSSGNFVKVQQRIPVKIEFTEDNDPQLLEKIRVGMMAVITLEEK
jgi:membrane fusion protein (multidrug efflux system)